MRLQSIVREAIKEVNFSHRLGGVEALYTTFDENYPDGRSVSLWVYPFSFHAETVETIGTHARARHAQSDVIWLETADLNFEGQPHIPQPGDEIEITLAHKVRVYTVTGASYDGDSNIIIRVDVRAEL